MYPFLVSLENASVLSEICYGPMKSGKSQHLMDRAEQLFHATIPFLAFKPKQDTRDGSFIKSRAFKDRQIEAVSIEKARDILSLVDMAREGYPTLLKTIERKQSLLSWNPHVLAIKDYLRPLTTSLKACLIDEIFLLDSEIIEVN